MSADFTHAVDAHVQARDSIDRNANVDAVKLNHDLDERRAMEKFTVAGIDLASEEARRKIRDAIDGRYDEQLAKDVIAVEAQRQALTSQLQAHLDQSRVLAPVRDDMHELVLYRRWEGRTLAELEQAYRGTKDAADAMLVEMVERCRGDLHQTFRLKPNQDVPSTHPAHDGSALKRLQAAIAERQAAREDATAREQLKRLEDRHTQNTMTYQHRLAQARAGTLAVARSRMRPAGEKRTYVG